jgi:hypothetical protein
MALWGIFDRDVAKRLYRHANVSESLLGHRLTSHTSTAPRWLDTQPKPAFLSHASGQAQGTRTGQSAAELAAVSRIRFWSQAPQSS